MSSQMPVYFDYAATTPVDERVLQVMLPYFTGMFGNPSSVHRYGQQAEAALERARLRVATNMGADPADIIFTACGTESDNLALRGTALARRKQSGANHLLISPVEHHAVSHTAEQLAREFGFVLEYLPVDEFGRVAPAEVASHIRPDTALVSCVYANNEIGTINPVAQIGQVCRSAEVAFHTDAVQAAAHLKMNVEVDAIDLMAIGAHKFYGPKGIGALYVRKGTPMMAVETGGKQEAGMRAGTQNIPYIVGLDEAFHLAQSQPEVRAAHYIQLRDYFIERVLTTVPDSRLTGHPDLRLPNHASFVFNRADGNHLLMLLDMAGFACSSGSACKVGNPSPSEVLIALGLTEEWALGSLRVTMGKDNTLEQVDSLLAVLPGLVERTRK